MMPAHAWNTEEPPMNGATTPNARRSEVDPVGARAKPIDAAPYRIHRYPSLLIDRVTLADGRRVTLRPVLPQDADAEQTFIGTLSPQSRRRRFHGAVNELPEPMLEAMTAIDYQQQLALVAEAVGDDGESRLVADARYVVTGAGRADFAIAVADDWQRIGLGRILLQRLARQACRQGIGQLQGTVQASNGPMLTLMRSWGALLRADSEDADLLVATLRCG
jgi:acetyltransferase